MTGLCRYPIDKGVYMHKFSKQSTILFITLSLIATSFGAVALAQDQYIEKSRSGEKMAADLVFLRPAGIIATALGSAAFLVSIPFSALGGNTKEAFEKMVKKPAQYTFARPLGEY
jgi:hypothetical protein